ncbi:MAG: DSD1 family PLP-dependent enzyme [Planctomycetaceae bacterium]|nr:DSD1 family PLP-dependent enzyme [Planctomycetaceae bacterium]
MQGRHFSELDTPAYCVDLDIMAANMAAMSTFIKSHKKQWRPHVKCHKVPDIAHLQLQHGAIGVTSAKASEAEVFIRAGIESVLIANMIVGEAKLERVTSLCRIGKPIVAVDHFVQAEALADVCRRRSVTCDVIIELNVGLDRVGVRPGSDALDLARGIDGLEGIQLRGVMGYEGHMCAVADQEEKRRGIEASMGRLERIRDDMLRSGICCDIVSAGGTATYQFTSEHPAVTELQCGGGIFADPFYTGPCQVQGLESALRLTATVVSRPCLERAVLDVGRKSLHPDIHPPVIHSTISGRPLPDILSMKYSAEHLTVQLGPDSQFLTIGDKVQIIPGYSDHTTTLHPTLYGLRNGYVETVWPIAARGCLQ